MLLLQVEAACCIKLNWRLLFSTNIFNLQKFNKFCYLTLFEVGGNTDNNAFELAMQQYLCCKLQQFVARITSR